MLVFLLSLVLGVHAEPSCPGEDTEAALSLSVGEGSSLVVCGFEDHDVKAPKGKRTFSDFTVYLDKKDGGSPKAVFASEESETYWVSPLTEGHGLEIQELWFFSEAPMPALGRKVICEKDACVTSKNRCIYKLKPNPFPQALAEFESRKANQSLQDDGEELLDQIFAQAIMGEKKAERFYKGEPPKGLSAELLSTFKGNQKKLRDGCEK